jgi:hypothetical protein
MSTKQIAPEAPEAGAPEPEAPVAPEAAPVVATGAPDGTRSYTVLTRQTATRTIRVYAESESAARQMAAEAGGTFDTVERTTVYAWRTPAPKGTPAA